MVIASLHFPVALFGFQCVLLCFFIGFTALHSAVVKNNIQIVTYLVSLGANVNAQVRSLLVIREYCLRTRISFLPCHLIHLHLPFELSRWPLAVCRESYMTLKASI